PDRESGPMTSTTPAPPPPPLDDRRHDADAVRDADGAQTAGGMQSPARLQSPTGGQRPASTAAERPFGAHLRLSWWKPLVIIPVLLISMFVAQLALTFVVVVVEVAAFGRDPGDTSLSPLMMAAVNLSLAVMGPLAVLLTAVIGRVPWRDRKSTRLNSSHVSISYAVFCLK